MILILNVFIDQQFFYSNDTTREPYELSISGYKGSIRLEEFREIIKPFTLNNDWDEECNEETILTFSGIDSPNNSQKNECKFSILYSLYRRALITSKCNRINARFPDWIYTFGSSIIVLALIMGSICVVQFQRKTGQLKRAQGYSSF